MRKLLASLFAAVVILNASAPAEARRVWPGHGAGGGVLSTVQCPEDKAMVGITGSAGRFIDRLQIVCATVYADGTYGQPEPYGDPVGGAGGVQTPVASCPRNAKLFDMEIHVDYAEQRYLNHIDFRCRDATDRMSRFRLLDYRRPGTLSSAVQSCPQEHFVGLRIYFREYVKAVGVICDAVEITPVALAPPPKPIRSSGRMPAAPQGPPVVHISAIRGGWATRTSSNADFTVILIPAHDGIGALSGQAIPVSGQFINLQDAHDYDGTLQGVIRPYTRTLEYTYVQKNGASGTGVFTLSDDGSRITGSGKTSDGQSFTWNGTRAR